MDPRLTLVKYGEDVMTVRSRCPKCSQTTDFEAPTEGIVLWMQGACIQDAFPELAADKRELFQTGICPNCWNKIFKEP
jgi:hypothetical protein